MCGRYRLSRAAEVFAEYFGAEDLVEWSPRFNIAPTQPVPVVRHVGDSRRVSLMKWGMIPSWSNVASQMINTRAETVAERERFRDALRSHRCLIPADGFYEWQSAGGIKQPYCFTLASGKPFAFAGMWDGLRSSQGGVIESCTILTTTANPLVADVHDRMPVMLAPEEYDRWLDPDMRPADLLPLLRPYQAAAMTRYAVSTRVNQVANDDPACAAPAYEAGPAQSRLF